MVDDAIEGVNAAVRTASQPSLASSLAGVVDADGAFDTVRTVRALTQLGDTSLLSGLNQVRTGLGVQASGATSGVTALANDLLGAGESATNTFDNLFHISETTSISAPSRPTEIVDGGR